VASDQAVTGKCSNSAVVPRTERATSHFGEFDSLAGRRIMVDWPSAGCFAASMAHRPADPLPNTATVVPGQAVRWSGMTDWRPDKLAKRLPNLQARARLQAAMRRWFGEQDFIEVETPILQVAPGAEVHLTGFATDWELPDGKESERWLHSSPEFAMKKLLAGGVPRLFQFARVFRNAEGSALHHPEFTMLEWYRAGAGYEAIMQDCRALLALTGVERMRWGEHVCDPRLEPERLTVAAAFARYAGVDLLATVGSADRLAHASGIAMHAGDSWDDVFFRIMFDCIEPRLGLGRPTILCEYPIGMAALARAKPGDPRVAERFELYVCGVELANAFGELTDPDVQRARLEADMDEKERLYGVRWPVDEDFLAALEHGLPDCAGIALGFDRLVMLATGASRIEEVLWLPVR
jgi:lysyl-tRNA synthetase class 2